MMTIFEPLFILLFLATVATFLTAAVAALRGQRPRALRILRRLAIGAGAYFAAVLLVAFFSTPPVHQVGETMCFDDWCITVADAKRTPGATGQSWKVTLRISSRAKRITQGEKYAVVYLTDSLHRRFDVDPAGYEPAIRSDKPSAARGDPFRDERSHRPHFPGRSRSSCWRPGRRRSSPLPFASADCSAR